MEGTSLFWLRCKTTKPLCREGSFPFVVGPPSYCACGAPATTCAPGSEDGDVPRLGGNDRGTKV